jgi:hypothetical protein
MPTSVATIRPPRQNEDAVYYGQSVIKGSNFDGSIMNEIIMAVESNTIRAVDLVFIVKDDKMTKGTRLGDRASEFTCVLFTLVGLRSIE